MSEQSGGLTMYSASSYEKISYTPTTSINSRDDVVAIAIKEFQFSQMDATFGAFFKSSDGKTGTWYADGSSMSATEDIAKLSCELDSGTDCAITGRIRPENWADWPGARRGVHASYSKAISRTSSGNYAAIAASPMGGYGFAADLEVLAEARTAAVLDCEVISAAIRSRLKSIYRERFDSAGFLKCEVIDVVKVQ